MKDARILVADEQPLILEGIRAVLSPHCGSIATVMDGRELVAQALLLKRDLIILDLKMPLLNGVDAAIQIKKSLPSAKLLFFTMHKELTCLESAFSAGAVGYVLKSSVSEELLRAIRNVLDGYSYVTPSLSNERTGMAGTLHLSPRERETLALIAEGKAAKEIGYILKISFKTVAFHRQNIRRKLGLNTTAELTRRAIEQGLV